MVDKSDLNNIHNRYGLALDTEENAKTILVGTKLKFAEEQMAVVMRKLRFPELEFVFNHYRDVRNEIGKLDDDIIGLMNSYIKEIAEMADRISSDATLKRMGFSRAPEPRMDEPEPDIDLGNDGTPQIVTPINNITGIAETPVVKVVDKAPTSRHLPKYKFTDYSPMDRKNMVQRVYLLTQQGMRTTNAMWHIWKKIFPDIKVSRQAIGLNCKKLGLPLEGQSFDMMHKPKDYLEEQPKEQTKEPVNTET